MLVQGWSWRQHEPGRRSRPGGEGWHEYLRSRWFVAQGGMRPDCIVMPSPALDDDHLRDPDRADRVRNWGSLRDQDVHLAQLGNDLFGRVSLLAHRDPPWLKSHTSGWTTPKGADQPRAHPSTRAKRVHHQTKGSNIWPPRVASLEHDLSPRRMGLLRASLSTEGAHTI